MKRVKNDFSLRQLEVFVHVVDLGSFSRAGEAVLLSQPTISEHIAALEGTFGVPLLDRLPGGVQATQAGRILYDYAQRMLVMQKEAMHAVQEMSQALRGTLAVGGSTIPGVYLLPRVIKEFHQEFPDVRVALRVADTSDIVDELLDGKVEVAIVGSPITHRHVDSHSFAEDRLVLVVPGGHRWCRQRSVELKEVLVEPFVMRERGSASRKTIEEAFAARGISSTRDLNVSCEVVSTEAVKEAVRAGLGVSLISQRAIEVELKHGIFSAPKIVGFDVTRQFHLVTNSRRTRSVLGDRFLEFLRGPRCRELVGLPLR